MGGKYRGLNPLTRRSAMLKPGLSHKSLRLAGKAVRHPDGPS
jgi:hypothetical protein